jgi:hypothetical protein
MLICGHNKREEEQKPVVDEVSKSKPAFCRYTKTYDPRYCQELDLAPWFNRASEAHE